MSPKKARTRTQKSRSSQSQTRRQAAIVDRYLKAVNTPKPRGRKVSLPELQRRLAEAQERARAADGIAKMEALKEAEQIAGRISAREQAQAGDDLAGLEKEFVQVAKDYGAKKGYTYGMWRKAGVPGDVLVKAGVRPARGRLAKKG